MGLLLLISGCASPSVEPDPQGIDPAQFANWPCERLHQEADRVQLAAADLAYAGDSRAGHNVNAMGLGVIVFWPALLAMRGDGLEAVELRRLKGRYDALQRTALSRGCSWPAEGLSPEALAAMPIALGERLVYDERAGLGGPGVELGLRLTAMRRDGLEFAIDSRSGATGLWRQDRAGNPRGDSSPSLAQWRRLLRRELEPGDVLAGELLTPRAPGVVGILRGQVVAVGPQSVAGRRFDVAVVELFGEAPRSSDTASAQGGSTRIEGMMAVDRASGVLLRLELSSANPDFALRRRLLRIESGS